MTHNANDTWVTAVIDDCKKFGIEDIEKFKKQVEDEWAFVAQCRFEEFCDSFPPGMVTYDCSTDIGDIEFHINPKHSLRVIEKAKDILGIVCDVTNAEDSIIEYFRGIYKSTPDPEWVANCYLPTCSTQTEH